MSATQWLCSLHVNHQKSGERKVHIREHCSNVNSKWDGHHEMERQIANFSSIVHYYNSTCPRTMTQIVPQVHQALTKQKKHFEAKRAKSARATWKKLSTISSK